MEKDTDTSDDSEFKNNSEGWNYEDEEILSIPKLIYFIFKLLKYA